MRSISACDEPLHSTTTARHCNNRPASMRRLHFCTFERRCNTELTEQQAVVAHQTKRHTARSEGCCKESPHQTVTRTVANYVGSSKRRKSAKNIAPAASCIGDLCASAVVIEQHNASAKNKTKQNRTKKTSSVQIAITKIPNADSNVREGRGWRRCRSSARRRAATPQRRVRCSIRASTAARLCDHRHAIERRQNQGLSNSLQANLLCDDRRRRR